MLKNPLLVRLVLGALCVAGGAGLFLFWKSRPSPAAAAYQRGKALSDARQTGEAVAAYEEAIRFDPRFAPPYRALAEIATDQGQVETAVTRWQDYLARDPKASHAWCRLAGARMRAGQGEEALQAAEQELKLAPDCGRANLIAGQVYERKSQVKLALERLAAASRAYPDEPRIQLVYGRVLARSGDVAQAEPILQGVIAKDPSRAEAYRWLGALYARRAATPENIRRTEQYLRRALELDPDYAEAHCELAGFLFARHRPAEALPFVQQANLLRKHYSRALYLQAQICQSLGRQAEAASARKAFDQEKALTQRRDALYKRYRANQNDVTAGLELAQTLLAHDEPENALRILRELAPKSPNDTHLQTMLKQAETETAARRAE